MCSSDLIGVEHRASAGRPGPDWGRDGPGVAGDLVVDADDAGLWAWTDELAFHLGWLPDCGATGFRVPRLPGGPGVLGIRLVAVRAGGWRFVDGAGFCGIPMDAPAPFSGSDWAGAGVMGR